MRGAICTSARLGALLLGGLVGLPVHASPEPTPLIANGDFRSGPAHWELVDISGAPTSAATWVVGGGGMQPQDKDARISSLALEPFRLLAATPMAVRPGVRYRFSALVRVPREALVEVKTGPVAVLEVQAFDGAGTLLETFYIAQDGRVANAGTLDFFQFPGSSNAWGLYAGVVTLPNGAQTVKLGLRVQGVRGDVRFTDVRWSETLDPASPLVQALDVPSSAGPRLSAKEFFAQLRLDDPALSAVKAAVDAGDESAAAVAYLDYRRKHSKAVYSLKQRQRQVPKPGESFRLADRITEGFLTDDNYNQFKGEVFVGDPVNWNFNPRQPDDPSYTREFQWCILNRMEFWTRLANAYAKTGDEKYATAWVRQMSGFVTSHPVVTGNLMEDSTHWRGIETGLRISFAWPTAYYAFLDSPSLTPEAHLLFCRSAIDHAELIERVIKFFPHWGGNHRLMEALGLETVALLFPELKQSPEYLRSAFATAESEVARQFYPDGAQTELTMSYHYVSHSLLENMARLANLNSVEFPRNIRDMNERMYRYYVTLMDQKGRLPVFNDTTHVQDGSFLSKKALETWPNDPEFLFAATLGKEGKAPALSSFLPYAGLYAMRSTWNPDGIYLAFDGGPVGTGHWHEDKLNFILKAFGQELLTEAGHYPYDQSPFRWYAISTTGHNTGTVDGKEQKRGEWTPEVKMEPVKNPWFTTPEVDYVASTYDSGYQTAEYEKKPYFPFRYTGERDTSVSQTRHLLFLKPDLVISLDFFLGTGKHRYDLHWHLNAPDAEIDESTQSIRTLRTDAAQLQLTPLMPEGLSTRKALGQMDPPLGWVPNEKRKIPTIVMTKNQDAPAVFVTALAPYRTTAPKVTSEEIVSDGNSWRGTIRKDDRVVTVFVSANSSAQPLEFPASDASPSLKGRAGMVIREGSRVDVSGSESLDFPGGQISAEKPASLRIEFSPPTAATGKILSGNFGATITNLGPEAVNLRINGKIRELPAGEKSVLQEKSAGFFQRLLEWWR